MEEEGGVDEMEEDGGVDMVEEVKDRGRGGQGGGDEWERRRGGHGGVRE